MPAPSSNALVNVEGYLYEKALPQLTNQLTITRTLNTTYKDWDNANLAGTQGQTFLVQAPTRLSGQPSLSFDTATTGSYDQEFMTVTADQEHSVNYGVTDQDLALYNKESLMHTNAKSAINEIATIIESFNARQVCFAGYRFFGDINVNPGQMQSVGEVTNAMAQFRTFGGQHDAHYVMPDIDAAKVIQSGLQQFVTKRNDEIAYAGEIGELGGVSLTRFYQSNLLPTHTAGTLSLRAANFDPGATIVSVTPNVSAKTSVIVLSGLTTGDTIVVNDVGDIGFLTLAPLGRLNYLTYIGYVQTPLSVQFRVVTGDTVDGGGNATITVSPALVFDNATPPDPQRNLSRAIVTGTDTLRIASSHRAGSVYFHDYVAFVAPRLADTHPWPSASTMQEDIKIAIRAYYGQTGVGQTQKQFVHDLIYGGGSRAEGVARVLYPLNVS